MCLRGSAPASSCRTLLFHASPTPGLNITPGVLRFCSRAGAKMFRTTSNVDAAKNPVCNNCSVTRGDIRVVIQTF